MWALLTQLGAMAQLEVTAVGPPCTSLPKMAGFGLWQSCIPMFPSGGKCGEPCAEGWFVLSWAGSLPQHHCALSWGLAMSELPWAQLWVCCAVCGCAAHSVGQCCVHC